VPFTFDDTPVLYFKNDNHIKVKIFNGALKENLMTRSLESPMSLLTIVLQWSTG
jgi:hypothetical protein